MHASNSSSELGMVKAWHMVSHEKPPSGLICGVYQNATRDESYLNRGSQ